jgi:hypothetical protein
VNTPASPAQSLYGLYVIVLVTGFFATGIPSGSGHRRFLPARMMPCPVRRWYHDAIGVSAVGRHRIRRRLRRSCMEDVAIRMIERIGAGLLNGGLGKSCRR